MRIIYTVSKKKKKELETWTVPYEYTLSVRSSYPSCHHQVYRCHSLWPLPRHSCLQNKIIRPSERYNATPCTAAPSHSSLPLSSWGDFTRFLYTRKELVCKKNQWSVWWRGRRTTILPSPYAVVDFHLPIRSIFQEFSRQGIAHVKINITGGGAMPPLRKLRL